MRQGQCDAKPAVTFPATEHRRLLSVSYYIAWWYRHVCERESDVAPPGDHQSNAPPCRTQLGAAHSSGNVPDALCEKKQKSKSHGALFCLSRQPATVLYRSNATTACDGRTDGQTDRQKAYNSTTIGVALQSTAKWHPSIRTTAFSVEGSLPLPWSPDSPL